MKRILRHLIFSMVSVNLLPAGSMRAQDSSMALPIPGASSEDPANSRQLFFDARSTGFSRDGKQQVFDGDVIAIGPRSIVTADKVTVDQESHRVVAEGHVVILAADQILTGEKIDYLLDTGDFRISGAQMIVNDTAESERISKEVLGFTQAELNFEAERSARLDEVAKKKNLIKSNIRRKSKLGQGANQDEIIGYARFLEQEDLITTQINPALASTTEARRNTLRKRRDFWEQSKVSDRVKIVSPAASYFRLEGDELTRKNGNDFNARHSLWTPCHCEPNETPAWGFRATSTDAQIGGYATFYDAMLEVKGIPVLYLPWMKIPIKDQRQSGLLPPLTTFDSLSGQGYSQALFLDLGRDRDATVKTDIFEKRGIKFGSEYRWKHREYSGFQLKVEAMRDRVWLTQRARRNDLYDMYVDGLATANAQSPDAKNADIGSFSGREYTRSRVAQRDWWQGNSATAICLTSSPTYNQAQCDALLSSTRAPTNSIRGLAKFQGYERLSERTSFVSSGEFYSDRQYNLDVYVPDSIQVDFDSGTGERAINPFRSRISYDGDQYFAGLGSYLGDSSQLNDRFEGYQLPLAAQVRSPWYLLDEHILPIYMRASVDDFRIVRNSGNSRDYEAQQPWLPGGAWRRLEVSFAEPLTGKTAIQVDHFTDLDARVMTFDGSSKQDQLSRTSSLQSWKTGFRFQLPIDGKMELPSWLGGGSDESGHKILQHIMNWSTTITARPMVQRRGPYGEPTSNFASTPNTWFATDRDGGGKSNENIANTEIMNQYQIFSFATDHRWKILNEAWQTIPGSSPAEASKIKLKMSYEERARRELLYTLDRPVHSTEELFSNDQSNWFTNRYQLLETDYIEPVNLGAAISYDRLKDILRKTEGPTDDNRPWTELESYLNLNAASWGLSFTSSYNIYDKLQTRLSSNLNPPGFLSSNISFGYTINRQLNYNALTQETAIASTSEQKVTFITNLTNPITTSWTYATKRVQDKISDDQFAHKLVLLYGSSSGCWGLGFAREKKYETRYEAGASYLLQLNYSFMGQTRTQDINALDREIHNRTAKNGDS